MDTQEPTGRMDVPDSTVDNEHNEDFSQPPPPIFFAAFQKMLDGMSSVQAAMINRARYEYEIRGIPFPMNDESSWKFLLHALVQMILHPFRLNGFRRKLY